MSGPLKFNFKTAIFVDWDNVRFRILDGKILSKKGISGEKIINYNRDPHLVVEFLKEFLEEEEILFRIFFYTCRFDDRIKTQNGEELIVGRDDRVLDSLYISGNYCKKLRLNRDFLNAVKKQDFVTLREGRLAVRWIRDIEKFELEQKQVDMLIGLDMAHLAYNRLVDRIILFSYDTDLIPAIKTAKAHGIQVILPVVEEVIKEPPSELIEHTDIVRVGRYEDIADRIMRGKP